MNKTRFRHRFLYAGPVLVYAVLIFIVSSITKFPDSTPSFFGFDKLAHFCEYYLFGFLSCRWVSAMETPFLKSRAIWMTIILGTRPLFRGVKRLSGTPFLIVWAF
jgi:hypothetical protein